MIASLFFEIAGVLSIVTFWAPSWILVSLAIIGAVTAAVGIYYVVTVPDGILTPALIPLGAAFIIAELAVMVDRYVKNLVRKRSARSSDA